MNCKIYNKGAIDIYNVQCKLETYFFAKVVLNINCTGIDMHSQINLIYVFP